MSCNIAAATFLGTSDEVDACDCCGRSDLKRTVALEVNGATVYYGVVCAANALRINTKEVRAGAKKADDAKEEAARIAREHSWNEEQTRWAAFCRQRGTGADLFTQIQSLGGYAAARALYREVAA
jgi:hypothetical protein